MQIFDTLTSSLKEIESVRGRRLNMFVCGPTVYDKPHMGHARTYIFYDVLAKYLRRKGFRLFYLMNITDMEDHIINKSNETGVPWSEITATYSQEFFRTMGELKNSSVNYYAFATDFIDEIISQISRLIERGYAYEAEDGVYFRVSKFKGYGKLSHQNVGALRAGARVEINEHKDDPLDFALWKKRKEGEPYWASPWGDGRPGWHIEDTAITESIFGQNYDIHGGAKDLIFPHHESEIAQMESISGREPMVRFWVHTGHLNVENIKMSKSLKNFISVDEALKNYWPEAIRIMMLSMHYSAAVNFDVKAAMDAQANAERISMAAHRLLNEEEKKTDEADVILNGIFSKLEDDMNTPEMMREIISYVKEFLGRGTMTARERGEAKYVLSEIEKITGIVRSTHLPSVSMDIILKMRDDLRKRGDFKGADEIRDNLRSYGIRVEDTSEGSYAWW
ncbi:MAG: cysteine--tRNA ligase [Thermoplasmatales archaeon]